MTTAEYQDLLYTTAPDQYNLAHKLMAIKDAELLHAMLGIVTEAGEFTDAIKKNLIYNKPLDRTNMVEELGDLTWYIGLAIMALGSTWGEVFEANIRKLAARYPERFIEVGIAEQNLIGVASGLATTGLHAYVCGYAPFIGARSMEQVRNDVAYAQQRVVIGAAASGIALGVSGGTHHALEDLALMRSLPHMTVIVPAVSTGADCPGPNKTIVAGCPFACVSFSTKKLSVLSA